MPEAVPDGTLLAFDYGTRKIGIAVGQTATGSARALRTVATADEAGLQRLLDDWRPAALVVGVPLGAEGEDTEMARAARRFGRAVAHRQGVPVFFRDERLTSFDARYRFAQERARGQARRKDAARIDALAAELILEAFLAERAPVER